jgi:hypothetical protein
MHYEGVYLFFFFSARYLFFSIILLLGNVQNRIDLIDRKTAAHISIRG